MPALKSNWLIIHVVTCFLAYAAFALGCGAAVIYLFLARSPKAQTKARTRKRSP